MFVCSLWLVRIPARNGEQARRSGHDGGHRGGGGRGGRGGRGRFSPTYVSGGSSSFGSHGRYDGGRHGRYGDGGGDNRRYSDGRNGDRSYGYDNGSANHGGADRDRKRKGGGHKTYTLGMATASEKRKASREARRVAQDSDDAMKSLAVPVSSVKTDRLKVPACGAVVLAGAPCSFYARLHRVELVSCSFSVRKDQRSPSPGGNGLMTLLACYRRRGGGLRAWHAIR